MPRIDRRALLITSTSALIASAADGSVVTDAQDGAGPSRDLSDLISDHQSAYTSLCRAINETGHDAGEIARLNEGEEGALLAVCSYRPIYQRDRHAKASYLLEIEARGELDLPVHIQALLRSML